MNARAARLVRALADRSWTVATAESLTGGLVCAALTSVPGSSAVVRGSVVAYAVDVKASLLGVDADLLERRGAVDGDVAAAMASGVRQLLGSEVGIATTGVAGPDPSDGQPVGTVYIAVSTPETVHRSLLHLDGDRQEVRGRTVEAVLDLALEVLGAGNDPT